MIYKCMSKVLRLGSHDQFASDKMAQKGKIQKIMNVWDVFVIRNDVKMQEKT